MLSDKMIGEVGGVEPELCAATGQPVRGRHASHFTIGSGRYIAMLSKARMRMTPEQVEAIRASARLMIAPKPVKKPAKRVSPSESKGTE